MKNPDLPYTVVTGAAGFIGSCLIRYLNDQGNSQIICVDDLGKEGKWKNLIGKEFCDLLPIHQLPLWLAEHHPSVGAIVHLGACSSTLEKDASYLLENNYRYTIQLADLALNNEIRFIYASSAATYGDGSAGFSDDHATLRELAPLNMYGYSKHLVDLWAQRQGVLDRVVGLKYFNVFGPNEGHKGPMASLVTTMAPLVEEQGSIKLFKSTEPQRFADGEQCRDFIYVKDAVRMTAAFLHNSACGIFNVGSGVPSTWNSLAKALFAALKREERIEYVDMPADFSGSYQNYTCADMAKTRHTLGEQAICAPLSHQVRDYIENHLAPQKLW